MIFKIAAGNPQGRIAAKATFWLLFRRSKKYARSAMEWHRKNRQDRFITSVGFARARRVNAMDSLNKHGMDATPEEKILGQRKQIAPKKKEKKLPNPSRHPLSNPPPKIIIYSIKFGSRRILRFTKTIGGRVGYSRYYRVTNVLT